MKRNPIYVEIPIHTEMDKLWKATQSPHLHEQWDLRFTSITYLPKKEDEPQHFSYETTIGLGIKVAGWGKSVGTFHAEDGSRTSSLHFGTDQAISIIREGKGYWKYKPKLNSIIFLTQYNYETSFGFIGRLFDQLIFRHLIGWGTALSFDVLKRWLEKGETPSSQYRRFFCYWLISVLFFFIWIYHGLIPKLLVMHPTEIAMIEGSLPISSIQASSLVMVVGIVEVLFGIMWLFIRKKKVLFGLQILVFPLLTFFAVMADSSTLVHPFTPVTYNFALFILSWLGYMISRDIPTAKSCKRRK